MAAKSPTKLNTSRNIALQKGVAPSGLKDPDVSGFAPITNKDPAEYDKLHKDAPEVCPKKVF